MPLGTKDAAQIIEGIERLPQEERGKVVDLVPHQPNAENTAAMEEPIDDLPRFSNADALFEELNS